MSAGALRRPVALLTAMLGCLLTGCVAGYHLGPVAATDYQSVAVPMFRNDTVEPQLEAQVTNAIIKQLQTDATLRVVDRANADILVEGRIIRYQRTPVRFQRNDSGVPREYQVRLIARVEARDLRTGKQVLPATELTGRADTFIGEDLQSADFQALPLAAQDLARQVVSLLVETW